MDTIVIILILCIICCFCCSSSSSLIPSLSIASLDKALEEGTIKYATPAAFGYWCPTPWFLHNFNNGSYCVDSDYDPVLDDEKNFVDVTINK